MDMHNTKVRPIQQWLKPTGKMECPKCNRALKWSKKGQFWLLLVVPYLVIVWMNILEWPAAPVSRFTLIVSFCVGIVGFVLMILTTHLERADGS